MVQLELLMEKFYEDINIWYGAIVSISSVLILNTEHYFKLIHGSTNKGWLISKELFLMFCL